MQKTSLGISVGLFGAALYFVGIVSIIPLVIMAGYALIREQNEWLKKTAVKAVGVVILFSLFQSAIGLISSSSSFLTDIVVLFNGTIDLAELTRFLRICSTAVSIAETIILALLGFKALKQGSFGVHPIDGAVNKHM